MVFGGDLSSFDITKVLPEALSYCDRLQQQQQQAEHRSDDTDLPSDDEAELEVEPPPPLRCKVCGTEGHKAGYVGAHYIDCCEKACFLCKVVGHTTLECAHRHRLLSISGKEPSVYYQRQHNRAQHLATSYARMLNECAGRGTRLRQSQLPVPLPSERAGTGSAKGAWSMSSMFRLHERRVSVMMFHPSQPELLLTGDGGGSVTAHKWRLAAVIGLDVSDASTTTTPQQQPQVRLPHAMPVHDFQVSGIATLPGCNDVISAALDGFVRSTDLITEASTTLLQMNSAEYGSSRQWCAFHSLGVTQSAALCGDNNGKCWLVDPRTTKRAGVAQLHGSGVKLLSLAVNPMQTDLLMSTGNDR